MIDLCTLGTRGTMPLPDRALASLYVRVGGRAIRQGHRAARAQRAKVNHPC